MPEERNIKKELEKICDKCWEKEKYQFVEEDWIKVIVNPNEILELFRDKEREGYFKI